MLLGRKFTAAAFGVALGLFAQAAIAQPYTGALGPVGGGSSSSGSGTVTSVSGGTGILCTPTSITTSGTCATNVSNNAQTGTSYATLATDGGKVVSFSNAGAVAVSLSAASTTGFGSGFGLDYDDIASGGSTTITAATSVFDNGLGTLVLATGQDAYVYSDGANYHSAISLPVMPVDTVLGNFSGAPNYPIASAALSSCSGASSALTYNTTTHAFGCNTISTGSGTVNTGAANSVAYYAAAGTAVSDGGSAIIQVNGVNIGGTGGGTAATGIFAPVANEIALYAGGASRFQCTSSLCTNIPSIQANATGGPVFANTAASSTNPTLIPRKDALTTGFGAASAGVIDGIIAGSDNWRLDANGENSYKGHVDNVRVVTAAGAVTVTAVDYTVEVNKTTGAATAVNLPATPVTGQHFYIKDGKGDAATNNITVTPAAGNIDGSTTYVINQAYGAVEIQYDGSKWVVL